jgi:hypothetical protein
MPMTRTFLGLSLALLAVGCSSGPRVTYEYEPTQTITSTEAAPAAPAATVAASTSTTLAPLRGWEGRKAW